MLVILKGIGSVVDSVVDFRIVVVDKEVRGLSVIGLLSFGGKINEIEEGRITKKRKMNTRIMPWTSLIEETFVFYKNVRIMCAQSLTYYLTSILTVRNQWRRIKWNLWDLISSWR